MNKEVYLEKKTFSRYDDKRCLVYLNEEVVENYVPKDAPADFKPVTGYAYSGMEADGGTLIEAADNSRDTLINGLIRSMYSQTEEDAIKTHQLIALSNPDVEKAQMYASEWAKFNIDREYAISLVDKWLNQ